MVMNRTATLSLFVIVFISILISCSSSSRKDGYKIGEAQLIEIIIDYQIAKAASYKYPINQRDSVSNMFLDQIYEIYAIDKYDFEHDLLKLESDPDYYKEIYDKVAIKLEKIRDDVHRSGEKEEIDD